MQRISKHTIRRVMALLLSLTLFISCSLSSFAAEGAKQTDYLVWRQDYMTIHNCTYGVLVMTLYSEWQPADSPLRIDSVDQAGNILPLGSAYWAFHVLEREGETYPQIMIRIDSPQEAERKFVIPAGSFVSAETGRQSPAVRESLARHGGYAGEMKLYCRTRGTEQGRIVSGAQVHLQPVLEQMEDDAVNKRDHFLETLWNDCAVFSFTDNGQPTGSDFRLEGKGIHRIECRMNAVVADVFQAEVTDVGGAYADLLRAHGLKTLASPLLLVGSVLMLFVIPWGTFAGINLFAETIRSVGRLIKGVFCPVRDVCFVYHESSGNVTEKP